MDRQDLNFRNGCQQWHAYLERCAKADRHDEAERLLVKIGQYLDQWKESLATARAETRAAERQLQECRSKETSIQMRMRMLGQLLGLAKESMAKRQGDLERKARRDEWERNQAEKKRLEEEKKEKEEQEKRRRRIQSGGDNE